MARRVSDNFSAGMITDVMGAENSLQYMQDVYVRRGGEIASRGHVAWSTCTSTMPALNSSKGWTAAGFHPNFGTGAVKAYGPSASSSPASAYQFHGAPLHSSSDATLTAPTLSFTSILEGTYGTDVYVGYDTSAGSAMYWPLERCNKPCNTGEEMVFPGELGALYKWGGSILNSYSTGTAGVAAATSTTAASSLNTRVILGSGTSWASTVQAGQYIRLGTIARNSYFESRYFRITQVISNTQLEIETPLFTSAAASAIAATSSAIPWPATFMTYRIQSMALVQSPEGVWNPTDERPRQTGAVAYHGGRLWTGGVADADTSDYADTFNYDRVRWSGSKDEQGTFDKVTAATAVNVGSATATKARTQEHFYSHLDLWHPNAYIDVFPGIGGAIKGLVSFNNELIVIKAHGVFAISGAFNYDGTGEGISLRVISETIGAGGPNGWALTKRGIVMACNHGLYLYDGTEMKSLTHGRMQRYWEDQYSSFQFGVTAFDDKVIIALTGQYLSTIHLIWMIEEDYFWLATLPGYKMIIGITTFSDTDEYVQDYMFADYNSYNSTGGEYYGLKHMVHRMGYTYAITEDYVASYPRPRLVTHPVPLGNDPLSEGRLDNILIHCIAEDVDSTGVLVRLEHGSTGFYRGRNIQEEDGELANPEYGIEGGTTDRVHRVPISESLLSPSCKIELKGAGASPSEDVFKIRIYSIGVEYQPANVEGPTA